MTVDEMLKQATEDLYETIYIHGEDCIGCEFNKRFDEYHPYGNTKVAEHLRECVVEKANECPGVIKRGGGVCQQK